MEATADHPAPQRHRVSLFVLFAGVGVPPLAWVSHLYLNYAFASATCAATTYREGVSAWTSLFVIDAVCIAVSAVSLFFAWRAWRVLRSEDGGEKEETVDVGEGRTRFLAIVGVLMGTVFIGALVFDIPVLLAVTTCGT
ncbi:MAG: hypothetical protein ABW275_02315 [Hansschlegelia sp.]